MSRLSKEEYREAVGCLKRYNYNYIKMMNIKYDIMSLSSPVLDGMPKAPYKISDSVLNSLIRIQDNEELQKCIREYKIVVQALQLVDSITKEIFEEEYQSGNENRWNIIDKLHISEDIYKRRKRKLVYLVHKEIKSLQL